MKAFFIYRDGELFGNPIGYTTYQGALKSLVGCEDWHREIKSYVSYNAKGEISKELQDSGMYTYSTYTNSWLFKREVWSRKVWNLYVKEHYKIIEKEFDIVFRN